MYYVYNWKQRLTSWIFTFYLVFQLGLTLACHVSIREVVLGESGEKSGQISAFIANNGKPSAPEREGERFSQCSLSEPKKGSGEQLLILERRREREVLVNRQIMMPEPPFYGVLVTGTVPVL